MSNGLLLIPSTTNGATLLNVLTVLLNKNDRKQNGLPEIEKITFQKRSIAMELIKGDTWGFYSGTGIFMTKEAEQSMERLASNGLNWICIPVNCFQETFYSLNIFSLFGRTQSDEEVRFAVRKAKSLGLKVCLKPMVDCLDRSWRARIRGKRLETHIPE